MHLYRRYNVSRILLLRLLLVHRCPTNGTLIIELDCNEKRLKAATVRRQRWCCRFETLPHFAILHSYIKPRFFFPIPCSSWNRNISSCYYKVALELLRIQCFSYRIMSLQSATSLLRTLGEFALSVTVNTISISNNNNVSSIANSVPRNINICTAHIANDNYSSGSSKTVRPC